jgi:hypothetical protein
MTYDPECEKLARYFLPSNTSERLVREMAQAIQNAVEEYIAEEGGRLAKILESIWPPEGRKQ